MTLKKMNAIAKSVSVHRLRESVTYRPEAGTFEWLNRPEGHFKDRHAAAKWNSKYAGKQAFTSKCPRGYYRGMLDQKMLYAHRAALALTMGAWPAGEVDHIDRNKSNNTLANLRVVTHTENRLNTADCQAKALRLKLNPKPKPKSKITGVRRASRGTWSVRIKRRGVERHIGTFSCFGAAVAARVGAV